MTEQGDAAVSIDISTPAPVQIAIAGTTFEVIVGVLDPAGSAHVLRFSRDGSARGRAQIPGEIPITQIAALGDHADQTIDARAESVCEAHAK